LLGEYGRGTTEGSFLTVNNDAAFAEAVYRVNRGVQVRAKYDWMDSNRDAGGSITRRYGGELDLIPMPFVQVQLLGRYYDYEFVPDVNEYVAMLFMPF
jgi:hypothetical protein